LTCLTGARNKWSWGEVDSPHPTAVEYMRWNRASKLENKFKKIKILCQPLYRYYYYIYMHTVFMCTHYITCKSVYNILLLLLLWYDTMWLCGGTSLSHVQCVFEIAFRFGTITLSAADKLRSEDKEERWNNNNNNNMCFYSAAFRQWDL